MVPHCSFDLHFSNVSCLEYIFIAYGPFVYLLWKNVYSWSLLIFELGFLLLFLSFGSSLYILDINLLSDIWFSNVSSHFFGLPLFSVDTTSWWKIFKIFVKSSFYIFWCWLCHWCHMQEMTAKFKVVKVCPIFSSKSFIVTGLTFRLRIHFALILYIMLDMDLTSFLCKWISNFPRTICWKDCLFSSDWT